MTTENNTEVKESLKGKIKAGFSLLCDFFLMGPAGMYGIALLQSALNRAVAANYGNDLAKIIAASEELDGLTFISICEREVHDANEKRRSSMPALLGDTD